MNAKRERAQELVNKVKEADLVILGVGTGLYEYSVQGFDKKETLEKWMPHLSARGYRNVSHAMRGHFWFDEEDASDYWSFWAPFIKEVRYETHLLPAYKALFDLVKEKEHFLVTTAIDGQWQKAGFDEKSVLAYDGDLGYNQCYKPCTYDIYYNEKEIYKMSSHMTTSGEIRPDKMPRCPKCGSHLVPNVRTEDNFVAEPYLKTKDTFKELLENNRDKKVLFLEIGEGYVQPGFIRYPFEEFTKQFPKAFLIRMNEKDPEYPEEIKEKVLIFDEDVVGILEETENL